MAVPDHLGTGVHRGWRCLEGDRYVLSAVLLRSEVALTVLFSAGFAFRSGFCYNDPTKGPKYFGDIFALVPRGIVLIIVVAMYSNLFIFLRRPDRISSPTSSQVDEVNVRSTTSSAEAGHKWWNRKRALGADIPGEDDASPAANRRMSTHPQAAKVVTPPVRPDLTVRSPSEKGAPWENLDLHVPDVTFGAYVDSRPTVPRRSSMANMNPSDPASSRLASRRGSAVAFCTPLAPMQSLDVPLSLLTPPTPTQPMEHNFSFPPRTPVSPSSHTTTLHAPASPLHPSHSAGYSSPSSQTPLVLPPPRTQSPHRESSEGSTLSQAHDDDEDDGENTDSSSDVDSLSPPEKRRGHALSSKPRSRKQSHAMSLKEILEQTGPPMSSSQPMTPGGGGSSSYGAYGAGKTEDQNKSGSGTVTGTGSGSDGFVGQESMNAYLNRKASLLMILFPIAVSLPSPTLLSAHRRGRKTQLTLPLSGPLSRSQYVALFSVSLVRIICDFVVANPIAYLSGLSRWMIFSQGIVDFVIYGVVEIRVKRAVRRKVSRSLRFSVVFSVSLPPQPLTSASLPSPPQTSAGYFAPQPGQNSHHLQTYSQQPPLETSHHSQSHV